MVFPACISYGTTHRVRSMQDHVGRTGGQGASSAYFSSSTQLSEQRNEAIEAMAQRFRITFHYEHWKPSSCDLRMAAWITLESFLVLEGLGLFHFGHDGLEDGIRQRRYGLSDRPFTTL